MSKEYKEKQKAQFVGINQQGMFDTTAGQQMENMYASTLQRFQDRNEELQKSTFQVGNRKYKDSDQMTKVKEYQQKIAVFMEEEVSPNQFLCTDQAKELLDHYVGLIRSCETYIAGHKHPFTASGKARLRLVKGTLSLARQEYDKYTQGWNSLLKEAVNQQKKGQKLIWGNLLGIIRGSDFDLDKMNGVGTNGAMTSELQVITSGENTFYFKEDEMLEDPMAAYRSHYLNENVNKDHVIYQKLARILNNQDAWKSLCKFAFPSSLKRAKTQEELNRLCLDMQNALKGFVEPEFPDLYLDFKEERVQKIVKEVLPKFEKWQNGKDPMAVYRAHYLNENDLNENDKKDHVIYQRLEGILNNQEAWDSLCNFAFPSSLKRAETQEELNERFLEMQGVLQGVLKKFPDLYLDFKDERVLKIVKEVLPKFEMWQNRKIACEMAHIGNGESLSKRNVLTSRMAIIMDMSHLVAVSNTATLHHGGLQKREGIVMEQAKGKPHAEVINRAKSEEKEIVYTPEAVRQFSCLQLFDTICGQIDRHEANRFVSFEEQDNKIIITGVQGIDHDLSFGNLKYVDLLKMQSKLPPFIEVEMDETEMVAATMQTFGQKQNDPAAALAELERQKELAKEAKCVLPALDKDMVAFLQNLTKQDLRYYLGDLLKGEYMDALWDRLTGVVDAINRTLKEKPDLLVDKNDWNEEVAERFRTTPWSYIS